MTETPKIAVGQATFKNGDILYNLDKMEKMVKRCKELDPDARLIVFPELSATGYFLSPDEIRNYAQERQGPIFEKMSKVAQQHQIIIVYGYVEDFKGKTFNSIQMIGRNGHSLANYRKIHLTPLEKGVFEPGSELVSVQTGIGKIGLMICWDLAFPELSRALALEGADLILAPSAWEDPYDGPFYQFGAARAVDNTVYVATCNHIGQSEDLSFFGKSAIHAPDGTVVNMGKEGKEQIIVASLDYRWRDEIKENFFTMMADRRPGVYRQGEKTMLIKRIVDLSIPITESTPIYPGDPAPDIKPAAELDKDGYQVTSLNIGSHTGTHVDAPFHFQKEGERIDQSSLTKFMGRGIVLDVTGKQPGEEITLQDVENQIDGVAKGDIVLFHTGWTQYIGSETYFNHPYLSTEIINILLNKGVTTFFIDALNVDPPDGSSFLVHEAITGVNGIIGENFCNFDKIDFPNPLIVALPLRLEGLDGSPVRAVAVEMGV